MNFLHSSKSRNHLLCLSLCLLSCACTSPDTSYFPLDEGYDWRYHMQITTMAGTEQQKFYISSLTPRQINGEVTFLHRSLTGTQFLYRHTEAGTIRVGFFVPEGASFKKVIDEYIVLPANLEVGSEWASTVTTQTLTLGKFSEVNNMDVKANIPVTNKIESITDVVEVPAGEFRNCLRVHTTGFAFYNSSGYIGRTLVEIDMTSWFTPGLGLIKATLGE